jgi:hypothetical protein
MLSMYVNSRQTDWDLYLPYVLFAYRTAKHASTGIEPFYLMYGRNALFPADVAFEPVPDPPKQDSYVEILKKRIQIARDVAKNSIEHAQWKQRFYYDQRHTNQVEYLTGDLVWVFRPITEKKKTTKLLHRWKGPYTVMKKMSEVTYELWNPAKPKKKKIVHIKMMKKCLDPGVRMLEGINKEPEAKGDESLDLDAEDAKDVQWEHPTLQEDEFENNLEYETPEEKEKSLEQERSDDWEEMMEEIVDWRGKGQGKEYLVNFKEDFHTDQEWIRKDILQGNGKKLIDAYERERRKNLPMDEF